MSRNVSVEIQQDAIEDFIRGEPIAAIEELIWNALDAEATEINVLLKQNGSGLIEEIHISDNGHGVPEGEAERSFSGIGGSRKKEMRRSPDLQRPYHGKEGKGRFKALAIGNSIKWQSRFQDDGEYRKFEVAVNRNNLNSVAISDSGPCDGPAGVTVTISDTYGAVNDLAHDDSRKFLAERLAPYLLGQEDTTITYNGTSLDLRAAIDRDEEISLSGCPEDKDISCLRIIEWKGPAKPRMYFCDESGIALEDIPPGVGRGDIRFSAYIISDAVRSLHESGCLFDLDPTFRALKKAAQKALRKYLRGRQAEKAEAIVQEIKEKDLYPYQGEPIDNVEAMERRFFNAFAVKIHRHLPKLKKVDKDSQRFTYRLLRAALESSPSDLNTILCEVLKLSEEQQADFASLLDKTSLGAIIEATKVVNDRLAFINGLEQILHDKGRREYILERKQLHRILADQLWIFGDEYHLGADDVNLKKVLKSHQSILGVEDIENQIPNEEISELNDIPDLVLWRQYLRGQQNEFENLVIELKRPTVSISHGELSQTERYAAKIMENRYFDKERTHWTFIAVSDRVASSVQPKMEQSDRPYGLITSSKHHKVWIKTWSQILHDAKIRLQFIRDRLEIAVDDDSEGIAFLRDNFPQLHVA